MTKQEKIEMLEEIMELEGGSLREDMILEDLDEWNSMTSLSLIVLADEEFDKKLTGKQIKEFKTVKDIIDYLN